MTSNPAVLLSDGGRARRWLALIVSALILTFPLRDLLAIAQGAPMDAPFGCDFVLYRDAAVRWLSGGGFYQGWQLTGHYAIWDGGSPILYPPVALVLLVPFTVLPAILWWAVPLTLIAGAVWRLRPAPWSWPLMAACLAWPPTLVMVAHGNPVMWEVAFLAVGCVTAGPAVLVLIKPTLAPFALVGVRSRRWWIALGGFVALSAAFGPMWLDWLQALLNSDGSIVYFVQEWPILTLPLAALAGNRWRLAGVG
jgi:hypothetical protein